MNVDDLIDLGSHKVRGNSNLMTIYIDLYAKTFGHKPNCTSCSFSSDWNKLIDRLKTDKRKIVMDTNNNKYVLKRVENKILTYRKNNAPYRLYDYLLTDAFAKDFLTYGTEHELKERRLLFKELPKEEQEESKKDDSTVNDKKGSEASDDEKGSEASDDEKGSEASIQPYKTLKSKKYQAKK